MPVGRGTDPPSMCSTIRVLACPLEECPQNKLGSSIQVEAVGKALLLRLPSNTEKLVLVIHLIQEMKDGTHGFNQVRAELKVCK